MAVEYPPTLVCEWPGPKPCPEEAVAKIGLPSARAIWVCMRHFLEWRGGQEPKP